ncbi:hypothetical protein [Yinghuangia soli]|uniref:Lipoprotein n=1 Tax=Yinghuangia soli TaxID=2908204 RepID=A0AA41Q090_9ACTN|nr:hypothetical protein [Yinghuangia soli]MCF2529098.1 hypothetical protein [Yinghuangia soli]
MITPPARTSALVVLCASLAIALPVAAGCAPSRGVVDAGPARKVVPPPTPQPLWPDQTVPVPTESAESPTAGRKPGPVATAPPPAPLDVPAPLGDDARNIDIKAALLADAHVDAVFKTRLRTCQDDCGLRDPVYRDLTGDGRPELLVSISNTAGLTGTYAYTVIAGKVFDIFWYELDHYAVDGLGDDLLVRQAVPAAGDPECCPSLLYTTRYRWNGREMDAIGTETEFRQQPPLVPNGTATATTSTPRSTS